MSISLIARQIPTSGLLNIFVTMFSDPAASADGVALPELFDVS